MPLVYQPSKYIGLNTSPDIRYTLARMLGMEEESLLKIHKRVIGETFLTLSGGICNAVPDRFGGVICVYALRTKLLVKELMKRKPLKTVVIVNAADIAQWSECKRYYGRCREDGDLVVTTKNTFMRHADHFDIFERIVCTALPSTFSTYYHTLRLAKPKIRWAICDPDHIEDAWSVHDLPRDEQGEIYLTREGQLQQGTVF